MTNIFPDGSRICAYCRDSGGKDQNLSVIQQREAIGKWCAEQGVILARIFEDTARSGTTTAGRDQFIEMVNYLSGDVPEKGVVLWESSRLARDFDDYMFFVSDLRRRGYIIHAIADNVPEGLDGRLLESITAWKNARYSEDLRKNTRRGQHFVARTYKAWFGRPPRGYIKITETIGKRRDGSAHTISHLIPDPTLAPLVNKAFQMRAEGATLSEIHNEVHLFKNVVQYGQMFANSIYTGDNELGEELITDFCEPLVDRNLWEASSRICAERRTKFGYNHPRALRSRFWLTGLLHCAVCGGPMSGYSRQMLHYKKYDYYKCTHYYANTYVCKSHMIPKADIEAMVLKAIYRIINEPGILADIYEEAQAQERAQDDVRNSQMARLKDEMRLNSQSIARMLSAIKEVGHSRALLIELQLLEAKQAELQQQIAQLESQNDGKYYGTNLTISSSDGKIHGANLTISLDDIIANLQAALNIADDKQRAIVVRGFVTKISARRDDGMISGEIHANPLGEREIVINL